MDQTKTLVNAIVRGLQEKKGRSIVTVDMTAQSGAICQYMVRTSTGEKPLSMAGTQNAQWIGMDYGTVLVHIFLPEQRAFYNLENLWADSKIDRLPDVE